MAPPANLVHFPAMDAHNRTNFTPTPETGTDQVRHRLCPTIVPRIDRAISFSGMSDQPEWVGARSPGITYQQLLDTDSKPVPDVLRLESPQYLGSDDVDISRYTTREWHELEVEHLWRKCWQYVCRADEIPEVGDYQLYEIVRDSYIVMRTEDGIKAYVNACLHRGRRLKDYGGRCSELRCSFHGFAWKLNGELQDIPGEWDFGHVEAENFSLPEAQVAEWAGFVFINPDPDNTESLDDFLGELKDQFEVWNLEHRYKQAHVAKVIHANWKIVQEAFCEAYHVNATHPQIMPYLGDTNSQVDIWDNFSRVITPAGTPSPLIDWEPTPNDMMRSMMDVRHDEDLPFDLPDEASARAISAIAWGCQSRCISAMICISDPTAAQPTTRREKRSMTTARLP